jgi:hypothetical protein
MRARDGRRMYGGSLTDSKQQQSSGCSSRNQGALTLYGRKEPTSNKKGRARALSRASSAGALALRTRLSNPKLSSIQLPNIQSTTTSSSPLSSSRHLESHRATESSHCQPHYPHTITDTTMADKFPSVEDLDSGIPLHLDHYTQHLD